jgi:site-specific recombinase XerD
MRLGNWLTVEEARALWQLPNMHSVTGKRDRAILAVLLGCGLRRKELVDLNFDHIQRPEDHWAIVDLTTEKYLGCKQRFRATVNGRIGIEPS